MNNRLSLSQEGANLVKAFESCLKREGAKYRPYYCPAGVLTIGWGHTNHHGRSFTTADRWTREECDAAFEDDMRDFEQHVRRLVKVDINQHQFDALVSFAYNCGAGALERSGLLAKVNRGDFDGAAREFAKWNKGGGRVLSGLVRRRASEALLFQGIPDHDYDGRPDARARREVLTREEPEPMPQQVDPPQAPKSIGTSKTGNAALAVGAGDTITLADKASDHLDKLVDAKDKVEHLTSGVHIVEWLGSMLHDPVVLVGVAILAGVAFIWWDRRRKLREEHV